MTTESREHVTTVPDGYAWCTECEALTPHEPHRFGLKCKVCDNTEIGEGCPNCHAPDYELLDAPQQLLVQIHQPGCHMSNDGEKVDGWFEQIHGEKILNEFTSSWYATKPPSWWTDGPSMWTCVLHNRLREEAQRKCGCPAVEIYPNPHVLSYHRWKSHAYDCDNGYEWKATVRCPVCGEVYDIEDSNC